jgi:apolipoprotein N-acyltransferase
LLTWLAPFTGAYGISFVIAAVNALWLMRFSLKERRYTRPVMTAAGVGVIVLYVGFLRHLHARANEGTTAVATLVQENIEVGAANTGPQLTEAEKLRAYSELSLYPGMSYCVGIPELSSTRCIQVFPVGGEAEDSSRPPVRTNLIVWPEAPNDFFESDLHFRAGVSELAREADAPIIVGDIGVD